MNHCSITSCFGGLGGGFRVDRGGEMVLTDSTMTDCLASLNDGGGIMVRMLSYLHLNRTTVVGCHGHARGGGFFVSFSEFVLRDCSLMECRAHEGGGLSVQDGSTVFVVGSNITRCHGTARGGGVMMNNGVLLLMNRTKMWDNTGALGKNMLVEGGTATYVLPAPPAHWVPASLCKVYRNVCPDGDHVCKNVHDACSYRANASGSVDGVECQPVTFTQPCDWAQSPHIVGRHVHVLAPGAIEDEYPIPCSAGLLGSSQATEQSSSLCAGYCPAGTMCSGVAMMQPTPCPAGHCDACWIRTRFRPHSC
eukprot:7377409-Prymnesium_polylepis.1